MSRERKVTIGALNIVLQPHSPQLYLDLFQFVQSKKVLGSINANKRAYVSLVNDGQDDGFNFCISGNLKFFTDIDTKKPWLDMHEG